MNNCILCSKAGKARKYFFKNKPLCDTDYIAYLEFLIKDMDENVTSESANDAYAALEISLKPEPAPKPAPKPYDDEPYSMSMRM
jgi:hypothetical protein